MSKQSQRRKLAQARAVLFGPLAMDVRAFQAAADILEDGDAESLQAIFGGDREKMQVSGGVAIIAVTGVLREGRSFFGSSYQQIETEFQAALSSEDVRQIVFYCDSPGGSAVGCKRVSDAIFAARGSKPTLAYVQGTCASAAYYVASACDRIAATADAMVGSIGTIFPHVEFSKFDQQIGDTFTVITNGESPKKGHGNTHEPLSDEAKATLQSFVDSYGQPFISDVARNRGVDRETVVTEFGQGDAMTGAKAAQVGMVDVVVSSLSEAVGSAGTSSLAAMSPDIHIAAESAVNLTAGPSAGPPVSVSGSPSVPRNNLSIKESDMDKRIIAQLFAMGLVEEIDAPEASCKVALAAFFKGRDVEQPTEAEAILKGLQTAAKPVETAKPEPAANVQTAHQSEMAEARLADLRAAADLQNSALGRTAITAEMVLESASSNQTVPEAVKAWATILAAEEPPVDTVRITGGEVAADKYGEDAVDAVLMTLGVDVDNPSPQAQQRVGRPLWALAGESLQLGGNDVDMYAPREILAEQAMEMCGTNRHTFYSENEGRQYVQAAGVPHARPGDFPNILSNLANKFLDTIELDDDYSYPSISAVLPGGLQDFKPTPMMNKGVAEELDVLQDAEAIKNIGVSEEILSHIFLQRFGNKWDWTPVMVANDDLNAFAEGMLGLREAWEVTQNRLVLGILTDNVTLLDSTALFANRADVGGATNNNDRTSGATPSDSEWREMELLYADIGGVGTSRRVRGTLNTCLVPTGTAAHDATAHFANYNLIGETKEAATTANMGIYRGKLNIVPESMLRETSALVYYGFRSPARLNTATIVRGYFRGYGTAGRRERWYDPTTKCTSVSIEGRIGVAAKNWRYAIRNAGA